ncbi:MAG: hypothetical protein R3C44_25000 [Chloroflexota bacterium]
MKQSPGLRPGRRNYRLVALGDSDNAATIVEWRTIRDGFVAQVRDTGDPTTAEWNVVTERRPSPPRGASVAVCLAGCAQHVKSNAIVFAEEQATVGIGGGLPSRVDAVKLAAEKAGEQAAGAVMASDAFFPFPDGIEAAAVAA